MTNTENFETISLELRRGVIVLAVAVLPLLGVGGSQLYKAETPGPMKDTKLTPRIAETARGLWGGVVLLGNCVLNSAINAAGNDLGIRASIVTGADGAHLILSAAASGAANSITVDAVKEMIALTPTSVDVPSLVSPPVDLAAYDALLQEVAA